MFRSRFTEKIEGFGDFCEVGFEALVLSMSGAGIGVL